MLRMKLTKEQMLYKHPVEKGVHKFFTKHPLCKWKRFDLFLEEEFPLGKPPDLLFSVFCGSLSAIASSTQVLAKFRIVQDYAKALKLNVTVSIVFFFFFF